MLVKTRKNKNGQQLYQLTSVRKNGVKTYYNEGTLSEVNAAPSMRKSKRHIDDKPSVNNRKNTRGRIVQHTAETVINHMPHNRVKALTLMAEKRYKL